MHGQQKIMSWRACIAGNPGLATVGIPNSLAYFFSTHVDAESLPITSTTTTAATIASGNRGESGSQTTMSPATIPSKNCAVKSFNSTARSYKKMLAVNRVRKHPETEAEYSAYSLLISLHHAFPHCPASRHRPSPAGLSMLDAYGR
jgi:hypothetical protein